MITEALLQFNRWANRAVLEHCRRIEPALLDAPPPPGVYGTIRATLAHLASAEAVYVARLRGEEPRRLPADADLEAIAQSLERSGTALCELVRDSQLDREIAFTSPTFGAVTCPVWVIFAQAIVHAGDHRSQLATILSTFGAPLPELDLWRYAGLVR